MKALQLYQIEKPYFGYDEIARTFGISPQSARVAATRYVQAGMLLRLKRNMYVLKDRWSHLSPEERFSLANVMQVPSYVSLTTALDYYEITTQMQRNFIECIALKRTKEVEIEGTVFRYSKIDSRLYFGFVKLRGFFIARPEKALLDALYLMSRGRYTLDVAAVDFDKLDPTLLKQWAKKFPDGTHRLLKNYYDRSRET